MGKKGEEKKTEEIIMRDKELIDSILRLKNQKVIKFD